jgi:hypothetical protein
MGHRSEALRSIAEAVDIYRKLAGTNPDAFLPDLARSYYAWGTILLEAAPLDASEKFGEGVRIIAPYVAKIPQAFLPLGLALSDGYLKACSSAGIEPDPEILRLIEMIQALQK